LNYHAFLVDLDFGYGGAISISLVVLSLMIAGICTRFFRPNT
jgi:2-methylisocitrate lyase-like PEP mutase family enzyme